MNLELDIGPGVVLYGRPRIWFLTDGARRGGSVRIRLGAGVRIHDGFDLEVSPGVDSLLELGDDVRVYSNVSLKLRGGSIKIGARTDVREGVVIKAAGLVEAGIRCTISYQVILHSTEAITLGDHVGLGERTSLIDSGHDVDGSDEPWTEQPVGTAPIAIGRNTMLFSNVVVMRGVTLGENCVIAAGSIITGGEHPDGAVMVGAPARVRKILEAPGNTPRDAGE
jgi:acetyltransferase-like isoleucine patch superfamily enzyme